MELEVNAPAAPPPAEGQPSPSPDAGEPTPAPAPERTVEDVERFWSDKQAELGRIHKAAERALRDEKAALERRLAARDPSGQAVDGTDDSRVADLERQLNDERVARTVAERRSKYPAIVAKLGDDADAFLTSGDPVGLAKLNASLEDGEQGSTFIAPTTPKRQPPAAAKPLQDKSKEELLDDLKQLTPAYQEFERQRRQQI